MGRRARRQAALVRRAAAALFAALLAIALTAPAAMAAPTKISARGSQFGTMLWGLKRQAVYIFQRDRRGHSRCYGACAEAWPPVYTSGKPVAGRGVRKSLLGTTRRRGGRLQVTYAGKPLYYYAHEGPRQVRCHNVDARRSRTGTGTTCDRRRDGPRVSRRAGQRGTT